jgi:hypothetical protein
MICAPARPRAIRLKSGPDLYSLCVKIEYEWPSEIAEINFLKR